MQPTDDSALLRQFAENQSDEAFGALVTRHINLVYSVALRHVGDPHHAEEITQAVFIILAKKALQLRHDKALSSWLFQATRLTANNFVRSEARRHRREQEAYMQSVLDEASSDKVWRQIAPLLDAAVAALNEKDRRAIVLRFYEGRNLSEVAAALGASEDAAKKRVMRALERLQKFFFKRGVDSTTSIIAGAISANSIQAAPIALAKTATAVALAKGATASLSTLTLIKGALKITAWTKMKTAIVAAGVVLLVAGTTITFVAQHKHKLLNMQPQIHIKARFMEIPKGSDDFLNSYSGNLDDSTARTLLKTIGSKPGFESLGEPEVTTIGGRQTQMRATETVTVITNFIYKETNSAGSISPQTEQVETGPVFDVVPVVLSNSQIQLSIMASITKFIGYANPGNLPPTESLPYERARPSAWKWNRNDIIGNENMPLIQRGWTPVIPGAIWVRLNSAGQSQRLRIGIGEMDRVASTAL